MLGRTITIALWSSALLLAAPHALAQSLPPELEAFDEQLPGNLINDPRDLVWPTEGTAVDVTGVQGNDIPGGGAARRYEVNVKGPEIWSSQTQIPLLAGISRGDTVTIGFHARTISADTPDGTGVLGVRVQENIAPYGGFAEKTVAVGTDWQWYEVTGTSTMAIDRENAKVMFQFGGAKQVVEIGQAIVVKGASSILGTQQPAEQQPASTDQPLVPQPLEGAGTLLNRPDSREWPNNVAAGTVEEREESTIWLGRATRFSVDAQQENDWDLSAVIPIEQAISAGDKLLIAIAAKTVSAQTPDGKASVTMRIQDAAPPYDGFAENLFSVGQKWQLIRINTVAPRDIPAGTAQLSLQLAGEAQTLDIGPVYIFRAE